MQDFDKVYSEYFQYVYKFVIALCNDSDMAEEITQETFFKALKNIDNFKGNCKISSWLCQIAKNTFITYIKKENLKTEYPLNVVISEEDIEKRLEDKQSAYEIYKVLHSIKEPYKEVFWLRLFGGLSYSQIGVIFEKSENWARITYYRAKNMIKENVE